MPSELDPLLPQNEPAPEISGNGYRQSKRHQNESPAHVAHDVVNDEGSDPGPESSVAGTSPIRTTIWMFICVVGLGLLISFSSGGFRERWKPPIAPNVPDKGLSARVDKILSENPLFGNTYCYRLPRRKTQVA